MHLLVVALRLAKIDPYEGFASNPRHITAESAVTRITLRYVSPCIRLELRRVRAKLLLRRSNGPVYVESCRFRAPLGRAGIRPMRSAPRLHALPPASAWPPPALPLMHGSVCASAPGGGRRLSLPLPPGRRRQEIVADPHDRVANVVMRPPPDDAIGARLQPFRAAGRNCHHRR
jgi:hypothetical protein